MNTGSIIARSFKLLIISYLFSASALAALEDNSILALDPQQGTAVMQLADGELKVISVGDTIPHSNAIVKQVLADKIVAEERVGEDAKVAQQVWIFKAKSPRGSSRVQRLLLSIPQYSIPVPVEAELSAPGFDLQTQGEDQ